MTPSLRNEEQVLCISLDSKYGQAGPVRPIVGRLDATGFICQAIPEVAQAVYQRRYDQVERGMGLGEPRKQLRKSRQESGAGSPWRGHRQPSRAWGNTHRETVKHPLVEHHGQRRREGHHPGR